MVLNFTGRDSLKRVNEQLKKIFRSFLTVLLALLETAVFARTWIAEYNDFIVLPFVQKGNFFLYAVYILLFSIFIHSFDGLKYGMYRKTNLITAQILATFTTIFIMYLQIVLLTAKFVSVVPLIYVFLWDVIIITVLTFTSDFLFKKLFPAKKTLILFDNYSPDVFIEKLKLRKDKFTIKEVVNISVGISKIEELTHDVDAVIIYDVHSEMRNKILKICFENSIRAYTTTKVSDILVRGAESLHIFDTPLLLYRNVGLTFYQRFIKRSMDIIISALMLIILSPIFLICAIVIKIYDGGPVFFKQARCTKDSKIFYIHKFRSMIVDAEADGTPKPAEDNDPRITPIGKILRFTRLDELPQLIDILVGNMSLVGPRPERIEYVKQYNEELPEFHYRFKVRGGLTGYAQLYGKYNTSAYDKLQLDLMYIQKYSIFLDIKLLLMTIKIMFMKESTEGFAKKEKQKED